MVKIRLKRMGTTKRPFYRLVVADSRSPRDGRFIEALGFYDPLPQPASVRIDAERVHEWLRRGARPSDSARDLLVRQGILAAGPHRERPAAAAVAEPAVAPVAAVAAVAADPDVAAVAAVAADPGVAAPTAADETDPEAPEADAEAPEADAEAPEADAEAPEAETDAVSEGE